MNRSFSEYVRNLSLADRKTRSQKFLKTQNEMGELAKVILPLENAPGSLDNLYPRKRMLEECCDAMLCLLSIAYADGFTDEDIETMMSVKADKWGEKQEAEGAGSGVFPFEIHVSVNPDTDQAAFHAVCLQTAVKPLVLKLLNDDGSIRTDMMTSSVYHGTNAQVMEEMARISRAVSTFSVTREKVETVPWHPRAPRDSQKEHSMPRGCYFEAHFEVKMPTSAIPALKEALPSAIAVSINERKQGPETSIIMLTLRISETSFTRERFTAEVEDFMRYLSQFAFNVEVIEVNREFAVWDTNPEYDNRKSEETCVAS